MSATLIAISGNIATGKTTLANALAKKLDCPFFPESIIDNPYLTDFYSDMPRWAAHLQFHFLGHRALQHKLAYEHNKISILERTVYEDGEVFVPALVDMGQLQQRDLVTYQRLFDAIRAHLEPPKLIVYLTAPTKTLMQRITIRGRLFERTISPEYLERLQTRYDFWAKDFNACPVLTIDSDSVNLHESKSVEHILENIKNKIQK